MTAKNRTILCIDDEEPGLLLRKLLLEGAGYRVLTAQSGKEGIRLFHTESVHAVMLDYWMSGMNGLEVAQELKRLNPATPIIILSAYVSLPDEALGLADMWVRKGEEDPEHLLAHLETVLSKSDKRRDA
jgi:CheY-like chemotaxis protein